MNMMRIAIVAAIAFVSLWPIAAAGGAEKPASAGPVEIEYLGDRPQNFPADADNFVIQGINKKLGINFKHSGFADGQDLQRNIGLRIASGNPPDLFRVGTRAQVSQLKNDGALLDLTPYEVQLQNWKKLIGDDALVNQSKFDGKLYTLIAPPSVNYDGLYIRKDWLDRLGLKVPATIDEMLTVAKAFTFDDPDGNGKKDTVGLTGLGHNTFAVIYGGFGTMGAVFNGSANLHVMMENGKAVFDIYNPRYRQALAEIIKWMEAGVVDPEIFTHKGPDFWNKVYQGRAGIVQGRWPEIRKPEFEKVIREVNPKAEWVLVPVPKGPYGAYFGGFAKGSAWQLVLSAKLAEPKNAAKLKKALELVEFACSDEGLRLAMFGLENVHYKVEGGKVVMLEKMNELTWTWAIQLLGRKDLEYLPVKFAYTAKDVEACIKYPFLQAFDKVVGNFPENVPKADIDRFIGDSLIAFIYGSKPLSEYDAFIKELETKYKYKEYMDFIAKEMKVQM